MHPLRSASRFIFRDPIHDPETSLVTLPYTVEFSDGDAEEYEHTLKIQDIDASSWQRIPKPVLDSSLRALHLILGINYWKMYCPPAIEIRGEQLTPEQARFWDTVYTKGLGEFFYRNKIDFRGLIRFPSESRPATTPISIGRSGRSLVPWGGGKDSAVTAELLKAANIPFDLFSVGEHQLHQRMAKLTGKKLLTMTHVLDPRMIARTRAGSALSGHIPYTAIYTFASVLMALLGEYTWVIFSNERSANIGNVEYLGLAINHQWSKSEEFELMARDYIAKFITPDVQAFSLLRPLYEIEIVRRFARLPQYFDTFSSCNGNFFGEGLYRVDTKPYWCGQCSKCAFVFACLAAFLPKNTVVDIVGRDMFADEQMIPVFSALLGIDTFKPFECVGTPTEMALAVRRAYIKNSYGDTTVMNFIRESVIPPLSSMDDLEEQMFSVGGSATTPVEFLSLL